jgi:hypothetical protein
MADTDNKNRPAYGIHRPSITNSSSKALERTSLRRRLSRVKPKRLIIVALAGLLIIGGASYYVYNKQSSEASVASVQKSISKHYLLPTDEVPALATVVDNKKISSELFKQAANGDQVLIYQQNKIAIVYRPSIDKVVAVGPVNIDTPKNGVEAP